MRLNLTPRLQAVAEQVPAGGRLADIGTDHAYLPVWLLGHGIITTAIAADLREGPLRRARETAAHYGVEDRISFRLCDGLSGIAPEETDTIAIAGMGGETIAAILESAPWTRERGNLLLLQPMTAQMSLREWLSGHEYCIEKEVIAQEGKRLYTIMAAKAGAMPSMTLGELWAGRQGDGPLRAAWLEKMTDKARRILEGQRSAQVCDVVLSARMEEILRDMEQMRKEL